MSDSATLSTALLALEHGACPIRGMADGSKRPLGLWNEWQEHRPTPELVRQWFSDGHPALGVVCGEISGRLECLEIEGRAMQPLWPALKERLTQAGLLDLLIDVAGGYSERSPSQGVHFLYRIGGDSEMPGNTKLASRPIAGTVQVESMIETRGEGGFIMIAPSNGPTHPTGLPWELLTGGWEQVRTITRDQRDALVRICESFDEMPQMVLPPIEKRAQAPMPLTGGWVDRALIEWTWTNPIEDVLQRNGWQYLESDAMGQLWRRPGKDRGSCSARVNLNGRLHVFSTSTPFIAGGKHTTTYDALDVELTYAHGHPPTSDQRVAHLRANTTAAPPRDDWSFVGRAADPQEGTSTSVTQPSSLNIPAEFWEARPMFAQIRDAAHSRLRSPDGALGATIARYATTIPATLMLPAIVGSMGTFDYMSMLVAPSGGGKSSTMALVSELLGGYPANPRILWDPPLGSGEGLVQALMGMQEVEVDGKKVRQQVQVYDAIHLAVDEGSILAAHTGRQGTVITPTLCTAWSGGVLGQLNASAETKRLVPRYGARITAVMGIQTTLGEQLIALAATGLPQRMVWFSMVDPNMPGPGVVQWPGELDIEYLDPNNWSIRHPVKVDPSIVAEIQDHEHRRNTGTVVDDPLDAHRFLAQLKTAGVFMFMDGRREISSEDWALARMVVDTSRRVRSTIMETAELARRKVADARVAARVGETLAIEDATRAKSVDRGARAMARKAGQMEAATLRDLSRAVASRDRREATIDEMLDYAVGRGWLTDAGGGRYLTGDAAPL